MSIALDTSALLARYLDGPARQPILAEMESDTEWCVSAVVRAEAHMLAERIGLDRERLATLRSAIDADLDRCWIIPVDGRCLATAAEIGRAHPVRTIDALTLAAASRLPTPVRFATLDPAQIPAALALGFDVISPARD